MKEMYEAQAKHTIDTIRDDEMYKRLRGIGRRLDVENLVFEGGGAKGIAYGGVILALSDLGILQNVKRFAGASIGAVTAMYLAIGFTADEIIESFLYNDNILQDESMFALPGNVYRKYGWFEGRLVTQFLEEQIARKTGDPKLTFEQLYKRYGVELCVIVTNVSNMQCEYCHPKTTPDLSIARALRMSIALPPMIQPVMENTGVYYSDGGLLNNYPIHVFDGWYLSMEKEASFLHMFDAEESQFGTVNPKTLGITLFNADESDCVKADFFSQWDKYRWPEEPDTRISRYRRENTRKKDEILTNKGKFAKCARKFIARLRDADANNDGCIDRDELDKALKDMDCLSDAEIDLLFGTNRENTDQILNQLDSNQNNKIEYDEILWFLQRKGIGLFNSMITPTITDKSVTSIFRFFGNIFAAMQMRTREITTRKEDMERTIGVYCRYIQTTDLDLEIEDKQYCMKLGWLSTILHLEQKFKKERTSGIFGF
ncbi:uncharacterized protein LOC141912914 isoform X2 [Tubulanus polymorphus]